MTLRIRLTLAGLCCAIAGGALAADGPYLFDVLKRPAYRAAWDRMIAGRPGLPRWLAAYSRDLDGPATPGAAQMVGGTAREFFHVCEAHNCADSQFEVMFSPGGGSAKGVLKVEGRPPVFLGGPGPAEAKALLAAYPD